MSLKNITLSFELIFERTFLTKMLAYLDSEVGIDIKIAVIWKCQYSINILKKYIRPEIFSRKRGYFLHVTKSKCLHRI